MSSTVIAVEQLSKQYQVEALQQRHATLREAIMAQISLLQRFGARRAAPATTIWALQDVSFEVKQGEVVGIIGRNGAGKSTLLKIMSQITEPTQGRVVLDGRVGSLLEVGTGFHDELSGRENIYFNGAILGMKKDEIDRNFDEIVAFSGVEQFLDTPVKRYSSGMKVRLAFSVAAHLNPEIMVIDEVLAVGDVAFQKKCLGKMEDVAQSGRTILFVSHNMAAVQALCQRALVIRQGNLVFDGSVSGGIKEYLAYLTDTADNAFAHNPERSGNGWVRLTGARMFDAARQPAKYLVAGQPASIEFYYENPANIDRATLVFTIFNQIGVAVTNFNTAKVNSRLDDRIGAAGKFVCSLPDLPLPIGQYRVAVSVQLGGQNLDLIPNALVFEVESSEFFDTGWTPDIQYAACLMNHHWQHEIITKME